MVPADSRRIPRVPRYSGYRYAGMNFAKGAVTRCGPTFQTVTLAHARTTARSYNPGCASTHPVWALPRSLATTGGIIDLFSLPAGTKMFQFPALASRKSGMSPLQDDGLSHSEIRGSKAACASPRLFAACRVLRRLREPRHPPCALNYFPAPPHLRGVFRPDLRPELAFASVTSCHRTPFCVENNGFEPLTPCLQSRCSSRLS